MKVHEIEEITGLTRANIRFYESQGLIAPARQENRYREYTPEHAEVLLRIKLLRALGMSLEQIKALQTGQEHMIAALDRQIAILEAQQLQLGNSQRVCREMRSDGVQYETLDARRYLSSLENPPRKPSQIVAEDVEPPVFAPWQRYWARTFDGFFYAMVLTTVLAFLRDGVMTQRSGFLSGITGFAMMLALEPVLLRLFGTTLGKWLFGIRVTDPDGGKLSLSEGFQRTFKVIFFGEGAGIPGVSLWRYWRSYQMYANGEALPWEDWSELTVKDTKPIRYAAAAGATAVIFLATVGLGTLSQLPHNRGDLTVQAYCENYRKLAAQNGMTSERFILADDGTWEVRETPGVAYIDLDANSGPLDLCFTTEDGYVTSVTISETLAGEQEGWISSRRNQIVLTASALLMAQEEYNILLRDETELYDWANSMDFTDADFTTCGLRITYDVEVSGYWPATDMLVGDDDPNTEPYYSMTFTVSKEG